MGTPNLLKSIMYNVALKKLGRREETAYHPIASCYLVTYRCELNCLYCLENVAHRCPGGQARELDTAGALKTLAGIRTATDVIDISGGEPALRGDLEELLGACRELQFNEIMLNSNGMHLPERPQLLRHVHTVVLGIDSLREESWLQITRGTRAQFQTQMAALDELVRLRSEHHFDLELCTVMLADHLEEIEFIQKWCFERGVMLSLSPHIDPEFRVDARLRADPRYRELTARLVEQRRKGLPLLGSISYYEGMRDLGEHDCVPMANLTVSPMGEIFWPCGEIQRPGPSFVEGKPFRQMIDEAREKYGPMPECKDRCHFSCRMALSAVVNKPSELPGEGLHLRRYRRHAR